MLRDSGEKKREKSKTTGRGQGLSCICVGLGVTKMKFQKEPLMVIGHLPSTRICIQLIVQITKFKLLQSIMRNKVIIFISFVQIV